MTTTDVPQRRSFGALLGRFLRLREIPVTAALVALLVITTLINP